MKGCLAVFFLCAVSTIFCMDRINECSTYKGVPITPKTLLKIAPEMSSSLKKVVMPWIKQNKDFLRGLVSSPNPYTRAAAKARTQQNTDLIKNHKHIDNLSPFNYILKPKEEDFIVRVNRWGSRMAYLAYATGQGSVLDPQFDGSKLVYEKFAGVHTYQHVSHLAHYLRLSEIIKKKSFQYLKTSPTHLVHIPGQPEECCDENYVAVQEFVPGFVEFRTLEKQSPEKYKKVVQNLPKKLMQEMYEAAKYAALWDISPNIGLASDGNYYIFDLEEPFNHKPNFFYFQGKEGYKKYLEDVRDGLERVADRFKKTDGEKFKFWKYITQEDKMFLKECEKQNIVLNYFKS